MFGKVFARCASSRQPRCSEALRGLVSIRLWVRIPILTAFVPVRIGILTHTEKKINPNGVLWTVMLEDDSVQVDFANGQAVLNADIDVQDYTKETNALALTGAIPDEAFARMTDISDEIVAHVPNAGNLFNHYP